MKSAILVILVFLSMAAAQQIPQQLTQQLIQQPAQQTVGNFVPDVILSTTSPFYVPAGFSSNVSLKAVNNGRDPVENVVIDVGSANNSVMVDGPTQRSLGSLVSGEERETRYTLYSSYETPPGTYYIPVNVSYLRHNRPFSYTTGLGVSVLSSQPVFYIDVLDSPIEVGVGGNVTIKVKNVGDYPVHNAYAMIKRPQPAAQGNATGTNVTQLLGGSASSGTSGDTESAMVIGSATVFIGDIAPEEQESISYTIVPDADLAPGTYSYEMQISYSPQSANQSVNQSYPFGILFVGKPSVYLSSIEIARSASGVTISGDANNVGSEQVKSVILEATEDEFFAPAYSGSTYYVGTMEPDDFIPFELGVISKKPNTGTYNYNISIRYLDSRNEEHTGLFAVTMPPMPPETEPRTEPSVLLIAVLISVIAIIVIVAIVIVRRRKRNE
jgi:hypothetical protein